MKTILSRKTKQLASSLLVALVITGILSLTVMGYLYVVEQQNYLSARSQTWNIAIAVVEAGVEEAMQQLNNNYASLSADNWSASGGVYTRTRELPDGNSYTVAIDASVDPVHPTIYAKAQVAPPYMRYRKATFFASGNMPSPDPTVQRAVRVRTAKSILFQGALVAKRNITFDGNGIYTDSYDSTDWNKSVLGRYSLSKYSGDKGDVATNGGIIGVGNANIFGTVHIGPNCEVDIGSNGGVGPHGAQTKIVNDAIAKGYILPDANFTYPETYLPVDYTTYLDPKTDKWVEVCTNQITSSTFTTSGYPTNVPFGGVITNAVGSNVLATIPNPPVWGTTTNYHTTYVTKTAQPAPGTYVGTVKQTGAGYSYWQIDYILSYNVPVLNYIWNEYSTNSICHTNHYDNILYSNNKYQAGSLTGNTLVVGPNVTLVLPNGLTGAENITFNDGASLLVFSGGTQVTINGNQYLNPNANPMSFVVYCAPSVTKIALNGNGQFTGVLVAPNADIDLNGGGWSNTDFSGALMVNSAKLNGKFSFHFDEALLKQPANGRYIITAWDEVDPNTF